MTNGSKPPKGQPSSSSTGKGQEQGKDTKK